MNPTPSSDNAHEHADPTHPFPIAVVYNGKDKHVVVTLQEQIKVALADAIKIFQVTQQQHMLSLFTEAGVELDDNSTIQQNAITKDSVHYLRQSKVKGGAM
jgi:dienelactone hydrolase